MIVDSSVLMAIALNEPEGREFRRSLREATSRRMNAGSVLEISIVLLGRRGLTEAERLPELLRSLDVEVVPFAEEHAALALQAYALYGKGRGHRAQLNFGGCMSYALARATGEELLFKGEDFTWTDLLQA